MQAVRPHDNRPALSRHRIHLLRSDAEVALEVLSRRYVDNGGRVLPNVVGHFLDPLALLEHLVDLLERVAAHVVVASVVGKLETRFFLRAHVGEPEHFLEH